MAILIVALAYFSSISAAPKKVCRARICVDYANKLRNHMNTEIKPCDDFYKYVCGNFDKNLPLPTNRIYQHQSTITPGRLKNRLREILEAKNVGGKNPFVKKARELYKLCMDTSTIKENGIGEIMNYIKQTGGWPIIMSPSEWEKSKKSGPTVDSEYNVIMGISPFVNFDVGPVYAASDINYLIVRPSYPPNDNGSLMEDDGDLFKRPEVVKIINLIKKIAGKMARKIRYKLNETQVEKDAQGIVQSLDYLNSIAGLDGSKSFKFTTIQEFQASCDSSSSIPPTIKINWLQRIKQLFTRKSSASIKRSTKIIVVHEGYFKGLSLILNDIPERDMVNTIQWWFINQTLTYTNPEMLGIHDDPRPRWEKCIQDNELQSVLAYVQVKKKVAKKINARVVNMAKEVKNAMKKEINDSEWLDEYSKSAAMGKVDDMTPLVGYPDWYNDPTKLGNELYQNLLKGSSYLENVLLVKQFKLQRKLELLGKPWDKWSLVPSMIDFDAFYYFQSNAIVLPIGLLQEPRYNDKYPDPINYGDIGTIIGHEIGHAFDSRGIYYNKHGEWGIWWSNNSTSEHEKRCQCFIDQYNEYRGFGNRTLNENIADFISVSVAFKAHKENTKKDSYMEKKLPGFQNFTSDQLFFVSFARAYCTDVTEEFVKTFLIEREHSLSPQRVNGALSNSEDFSKTFKCEKNSPMNRAEKRCTIW